MTDSDIKLLSLLIGIVGSFIGASVGVLLFIWREARQRYQQTLASCRSFVIMTTWISEYVECGATENIDFKPKWLISNCNALMRDSQAHTVVINLVKTVAQVKQRVTASEHPVVTDIVEKLADYRNQAEWILKRHSKKLRRFVLLSW
jgi:hypothetical protein